MRLAALVAMSVVAVVGVGTASGVTPAAALAAPADEVQSVWPPTGPKWETNPEAAFAKARAEDKGVFVYIATEG